MIAANNSIALVATSMSIPAEWQHSEFARVVACKRCTLETAPNLLRDDNENVPQPGYIGPQYRKARVLLVGQNPGTPKSLAIPDRPYTAALRLLRDEPTPQRYRELDAVIRKFIPQWPVHRNHFPLCESGLLLEDIAYCNIVRCRTVIDSKPGKVLSARCICEHFIRWLNLLEPNVVVFVGKWAWEQGRSAVQAKGIPCAYMNRQRSLSPTERKKNRDSVVALVRKCRG